MKIQRFKNYKCYFSNNIIDLKNILDEYKNNKIFFLIDDNVYRLYKNDLNILLNNNSYLYLFKALENNKNLFYYEKIINELLSKGIKKDSLIVAIGGGITLDLAGFLSNSYLRGIKFISVPTTLLSQVDAAFGGKNGLNIKNFKNQIGSFYFPEKIFISYRWLHTLDNKDIENGYAEILKTFLVKSKKDYFKLKSFNKLDYNQKIINKTINIKEKIVKKDIKDNNYRHILNFGHTFGHAIESYSNYSIPHGHAVLLGIIIELKLGLLLKITPNYVYEEVKKYILSLNIVNYQFNIKDLLEYIKHDKKRKNSYIKLPILKNIGRCKLVNIKMEKFYELINKL